MGFYLRKAIRVGPIRFNLSKSGIGVSAGIKGLRLGSGPRSNYVHMGRKGIYYRATLPKPLRSQRRVAKTSPPEKRNVFPEESPHELEEIESGSVLNMVDSSSAGLLEELNAKCKKGRIWPAVAALGFVCVVIAASSGMRLPGLIALSILASACAILAYFHDEVKRSVVLFYELEGATHEHYQAIHDAFDELRKCSRIWHIAAKSLVEDSKRHAGVSSILHKNAVSIHTRPPAHVKTNISVPAIPVGRQTLHFFPDRLLVFENNAVGAVSYGSLQIDVEQTREIESDGVPPDAEVVGHAWKYMNKDGSPDQRFKNNSQLPVVLYENVHFRSPSGLNELIQLSRRNVAEKFKSATEGLARNNT